MPYELNIRRSLAAALGDGEDDDGGVVFEGSVQQLVTACWMAMAVAWGVSASVMARARGCPFFCV